MIFSCPDNSALVSLTLPTSLVAISDYACNGCSSLSTVTIPTYVRYTAMEILTS